MPCLLAMRSLRISKFNEQTKFGVVGKLVVCKGSSEREGQTLEGCLALLFLVLLFPGPGHVYGMHG